MTQQEVYSFVLNNEATNFNADMAYNNNYINLKSCDYKATLLPNIVAQPTPNNNDGILKHETIAVPWKYLSNFWWRLEMPLINCEVELKLSGKSIVF